MKTEILARIILFIFIFAGITIPVAGRVFFATPSSTTIELHARIPENGGWSMDHIQASVGEPIHLRLISDDVVHGFAIGKSDQPALEIIPGKIVDTTLVFDKPGTYTYYCTHWCSPNHWRMRGTIEVIGRGQNLDPEPLPLYLQLGIDIDASHPALITPDSSPSAGRGAQLAGSLPLYATELNTYQTSSPAQLWLRLRKESKLSKLKDEEIWDLVAFICQNRTSSETLSQASRLYAANCAACHGENGKGDGVVVRGLPEMDTQSMVHNRVHPPDFTNSKNLLGASPALLEGKMIRGGMGTGMPYWGPIFTEEQMDGLISYLYNFVWQFTTGNNSSHNSVTSYPSK
ncbi:MAG: c-type cytochrome [Chloroflexota bacterium]